MERVGAVRRTSRSPGTASPRRAPWRLRGTKTTTWSLLSITVSWRGMITWPASAAPRRPGSRPRRSSGRPRMTGRTARPRAARCPRCGARPRARSCGRRAPRSPAPRPRRGAGCAPPHVAAPHIGQQLAEHGLRRRQRDVDLRALHQVGVAAPVDQREHAPRAQALGQQAGHDVVFVVAGEREEQVDVARCSRRRAGPRRCRRRAAPARRCGSSVASCSQRAWLRSTSLIWYVAAGLDELPRKPQPDAAAAGDHHALDGAVDPPGRSGAAPTAPLQVLARRQHEHLVAGLDARVAVADDEAVGLVLEPAVDRDDAHVGIRARTRAARRCCGAPAARPPPRAPPPGRPARWRTRAPAAPRGTRSACRCSASATPRGRSRGRPRSRPCRAAGCRP